MPGTSEICSWAGKNGSLVVWWASEEALLGVLGIRDNWQNNFRDKG